MNIRGAHTLGPRMPSRMYKTFEMAAPLNTHFRRATCEEINCDAWREGWTYNKADLIAAELYELVTHAGKRYREASLDEGPDIYLVFEPGQTCFQAAQHRISLQREHFYFAGRGLAGQGYSMRSANQFDSGEDWAESFAEHQDLINKIHEEGI